MTQDAIRGRRSGAWAQDNSQDRRNGPCQLHDLKQIELLDSKLAINPGVARTWFQRVDLLVLGDRAIPTQWIAVLTVFALLHCSNVALAQTAPEKGARRERGTPAEQVEKIKPGKKMEVRLTNGES